MIIKICIQQSCSFKGDHYIVVGFGVVTGRKIFLVSERVKVRENIKNCIQLVASGPDGIILNSGLGPLIVVPAGIILGASIGYCSGYTATE